MHYGNAQQKVTLKERPKLNDHDHSCALIGTLESKLEYCKNDQNLLNSSTLSSFLLKRVKHFTNQGTHNIDTVLYYAQLVKKNNDNAK